MASLPKTFVSFSWIRSALLIPSLLRSVYLIHFIRKKIDLPIKQYDLFDLYSSLCPLLFLDKGKYKDKSAGIPLLSFEGTAFLDRGN